MSAPVRQFLPPVAAIPKCTRKSFHNDHPFPPVDGTWPAFYLVFHVGLLFEAAAGARGGAGDDRVAVKAFRYLRDPLCLLACLVYGLNRLVIAPWFSWSFFHEHFNDLLLIPAALPPVLWLQRRLGLRRHDRPPGFAEIFGHWLVWSIVCEGIGPLLFPRATGDLRDVLAYAAGALPAWLWWNRSSLLRPSPVSRFDPLAAHYEWMEAILAGRKLERCRDALWNRLPPVKNALLAGEGHGKFLAALLRRHPEARVTCLDASAGMLEMARRRMRRESLPLDRVEFVHADLLEWNIPGARYDLIATNFFLDCFAREQLPRAIARLKEGARPGAYWLISDFQIPRGGWKRLRAQIIHKTMYAFFRLVTRLPASAVVQPAPYLQASGFQRLYRREFDWDLLYAELWRNEPQPAPACQDLPFCATKEAA